MIAGKNQLSKFVSGNRNKKALFISNVPRRELELKIKLLNQSTVFFWIVEYFTWYTDVV